MAWQDTFKARWAALAARERQGLTIAAWVVGAALVWGVLIAPAVRTLKSVDAQSTALSAELERMAALQARAKALQSQPVMAAQDALKALQSAVAGVGKNASLQVSGELATLTLKQVSSATMAQWLGPQPGLSLSPFEVRVQRDLGAAEALWSGTLVFRLPGNST
jgi:general secretion pathway protein M